MWNWILIRSCSHGAIPIIETNNVSGPVLKAIKKCNTHPGVLSNKKHMNNNVFSFQNAIYEEILNDINSLYTWKSAHADDIPFNIIKDTADAFANFILKTFSKCIIDGKFPYQLKKTDVSPVFRKGNHNDKIDYWPVTILSSLSKIYERFIYNQIN